MVFSSLTFIFLYLPIVLLLYYIAPWKAKNFILLITGLIFYAWGEPYYVIIMIISTLIDYTAGLLINKFNDKPKIRRIFLILSVVMNLSLLFTFKYSSFIITNINSIFGLKLFNPNLPLPIGISFYTFQSMSYTIDLYLGNIKVQKNFTKFAAYVTMFPQIVAGPIVRYEDVERELEDRQINITLIGEGVGHFVKGLAKKVLIANNIGMLWTTVKAMEITSLSTLTAWIGILAFTFQIYFDFSGYSDMAIGLGKMLGFHFPQNFDYPYTSRSISEFWRRWHITLGSWFRSYVYIPLGGNREGTAKTLRNLLIVWALTGLWHGASWNFIIWGLYFGIIIILERLFLRSILEKIPAAISTAYSFILVVFGWVLFETNTLADAGRYIKAMFGAYGGFIDTNARYLLTTNIVMFAICIILSTRVLEQVGEYIATKLPVLYQYSAPVLEVILMIICTAYLVDSTYNPFLYFRF